MYIWRLSGICCMDIFFSWKNFGIWKTLVIFVRQYDFLTHTENNGRVFEQRNFGRRGVLRF